MKHQLNRLYLHRAKFLLPFYFLVAAVVLTYLLPKEAKFKYEFQKGKPWQHHDLIAPFDFPIYKYPEEIKQEEDSLTAHARPYYRYDNYRGQNMVALLQQRFNTSIDALKDSLPPNLQKIDTIFPNQRSLISNYRKVLLQSIQFVYVKGVFQPTEDNNSRDERAIVVVQDGYAQELPTDELFTPTSAFEYLDGECQRYIQGLQYGKSAASDFYYSLNINELIVPNLDFDPVTTQKVNLSRIQKITISRGMVQKGERIITRGEMVGEANYRVLYSLKRDFFQESNAHNVFWIAAGQGMLVSLLLLALFQFLATFRLQITRRPTNVFFMLMLIVLSAMVTKAVVRFEILNVYLIPYVVVPFLLKNFFDTRIAFINHIINISLMGFLVPNSFEFVYIQLTSGLIGMYFLTNFYRRGNLTLAAGIVFLVYLLSYSGYSLMQEGDIRTIDYSVFLWFAANSVLILITYPAIYIFEKLFGFISETTLIELGDVNQPLLRQLAEKAPGTFQHSLQVANLSESAAFKIAGANPLLIRTGALYHDIGKTLAPQYFTENQINGINPHDQLSFEQSADIIIGHVTKGIDIARKHQLPNQIIDFIRTHHGTSKAHYFYRMHLNKFPDQAIDEQRFTYPGPKPFSKDTAIVMMADAVEAASRSLKEISERSISELIDKIIDFQIAEQQFTEADITFKDIHTIKTVFRQKLMNIYHARISYPEERKRVS